MRASRVGVEDSQVERGMEERAVKAEEGVCGGEEGGVEDDEEEEEGRGGGRTVMDSGEGCGR